MLRTDKCGQRIKAIVMQSATDNYTEIENRLRELDIEAVRVESTRQAFSVLESYPCVHLVIADVLMPRESAYQVLKGIKENPRFQWYPVAMTSSAWDQNSVRVSLELGADAILAMPVGDEVFSHKVEHLLANGRRVVLIVDDEETIRSYMQTILDVERFVVKTVSSSDEALAFVQSNTVHAVITDIMMPGMNGFDLMVEIKKAHDHIPVILITGYGGRYSADRAIAAGADGYFQKPFKNTELITALRRVLRIAKNERAVPSPA